MPPFLFNYLSDPRTTQHSFLTQTPIMASSSERPQSVSITLTPEDDPSDKRTIVLNVDKPITIGRSSRSEPKNLTAGITNALFDNPVVSRKHAQLELHADPLSVYGKEVTITDIGSMHGTWLNEDKLDRYTPVQLRSGDTIKFGDKVVRNIDTHDGLTVSVEITDSTSYNDASHMKSFTGSYKVPSDSEYDSDDMDSDYSHDDENTSSAHTTPEQANAKPGSQQSPIDIDETTHEVIRDVIDLASDDGLGDSNQPIKSRLKPNTTIIQDSYEDPSLRVADSYAGPQRSVFRPWQSRRGLDKEADQDEVEAVMKHNTGLAALLGAEFEDEEEIECHSEDDDNGDHAESADGSMAKLGRSFDDDDNALDARDDDDLSASDASDIADIASVSEDEGPEVFSSKRQISPELGTLGQSDTAVADVFTYSVQSNSTAKLHYDPVRGSAPPSPAQAATASSNAHAINTESTRPRASRWDVGPMTSQYYSIPNPVPHDYTLVYQDRPLKPSATQPKAPVTCDYTACPTQMAMPKFGETSAPQQNLPSKPASKLDIMNLVEDRAAKIQERIAPTGTKRKADDMVELEPNSVPSALSLSEALPTYQPVSSTPQVPSELMQQDVSSMEVDQPHMPVDAVAQEPPKKKTKRTDLSVKISFPTKEIAKAAGYMALGGAATIGFLVSDAAQRLLS